MQKGLIMSESFYLHHSDNRFSLLGLFQRVFRTIINHYTKSVLIYESYKWINFAASRLQLSFPERDLYGTGCCH